MRAPAIGFCGLPRAFDWWFSSDYLILIGRECFLTMFSLKRFKSVGRFRRVIQVKAARAHCASFGFSA